MPRWIPKNVQCLYELAPAAAKLADGVLLDRFVNQGDQTAFELLVHRHGAMVLGVCRRVLHNGHDAEDAFQAVFLILLRKAPSLFREESLAGWLYRVAYHAAMKGRTAAWKRKVREKMALPMPHDQGDATGWLDLRPLLDQELQRLPARYRDPVILCELEGRSRREVAQQLGIPEGTLSSRLATARRMLARRLARHGLVLTAATWSASVANAALPAALVTGTVATAAAVVAGEPLSTAVSAPVAAIALGVLRSGLFAKFQMVVALSLTVAAGAALALQFGSASVPPLPAPAVEAQQPALLAPEEALPPGRLLRGAGIFGDLDRTFAGSGKVIFKNRVEGCALALDAAGRIVVAGRAHVLGNGSDFGVTRLLPDGSVDAAFGNGGTVTTSLGDPYDVPTCLAIDRDGKIVVAGWTGTGPSRFALVRYHPDGKLDASFGCAGIVITNLGPQCKGASCLALDAQGRIVVAGTCGHGGPWAPQVAVIRYNSDGSLDTTFAADGWLTADFGDRESDSVRALAIDAAGKIVLVGGNRRALILTRYHADGTLDRSLGGTGLVTLRHADHNGEAFALLIERDGKLLVGGYQRTDNGSSDFILARFHPDGRLDADFGSAGVTTTPADTKSRYALSLARQDDGKIILVGDVNRTDLTILRYHADGNPDTTFGVQGRLDIDLGGAEPPDRTKGDEWAAAVVVDRQGRLVVAGSSNRAGYHAAVLRIGNNAPTGLELTSTTIREDGMVGALSAIDSDARNTFTYRFIDGEGDTDNRWFAIAGDELVARAGFGEAQRTHYRVRIQVTDQSGLSFARAFVLTTQR